jgi:hypothetical protein
MRRFRPFVLSTHLFQEEPMFTNRLSPLFYRLVCRLIACRLARDYKEYHASTEDSYVARIGPCTWKSTIASSSTTPTPA